MEEDFFFHWNCLHETLIVYQVAVVGLTFLTVKQTKPVKAQRQVVPV